MNQNCILGDNLIKGEGIKKNDETPKTLSWLAVLNGIVLASLSRNFFTDLRNASVEKPNPRFASSISQSANWLFFVFLFFVFLLKKKKNLEKGLFDGQRSLYHLV